MPEKSFALWCHEIEQFLRLLHDDIALARNIGKLIGKRRELKGLTQNEVAEQLGIGYEAVSRMERGHTLPSAVKLMRLADLLECPVEELVSETSSRADDQAQVMLRMTEELSAAHRSFVIAIADRLNTQLRIKARRRKGVEPFDGSGFLMKGISFRPAHHPSQTSHA